MPHAVPIGVNTTVPVSYTHLYAAMISLGRRPEHTPDRDAFVARTEATIGLDTWTLDYDAALSEGDLPLECGSPATYEGMTVFLETERDLSLIHI